ncbi:MAG: glucose PTS transporter subunit IIA, partial [Sterolibacterium sp.]
MSGTIDLTAPFDGIAVPLTAVSDPVFAGLMMGDGLAIEPLSSTLLAPCNGVVTHLARTGHALTLSAANGAEVLIHIGIDSVRLNGEGFSARIRQGDTVRCGQALIDVDIDAVAQRVPSLQTMVVIAGAGYRLSARASGLLQAGITRLLSITPGETPATGASGAAHAEPSGPAIRRPARVAHRNGLHARPAALVQASLRLYAAEVVVEFGERQANARSVTALMGLGVDEGADVIISARGADAAGAAEAVIEALQAEGHPIGRGSVGENITVRGLPWADVQPGVLLRIGTVLAHVQAYAEPCNTNSRFFLGGDFQRMNIDRGPVSRVYATV